MNAAAATGDGAGGRVGRGKADMSAWLAVLAGTIGSFMATLDISIVNAALPTIQGEVGASGTEGTWISTAYLVAEIIMIPLTGWFVRTLGLRNFLLICAVMFTAFSVVCGLSTTLTMMIIGRVGQGLAGGALIPTALTIVATRLPPSQQTMGTALFGMTVIMGPVIGPLLGGWLTENVSWHYAFFINVPICAGLVALLLLGLEHEKGDWAGLLDADWLGIYGLTAGLGGLTVVLEEGQRERWFESSEINTLSLIALSGFIALIIGQFRKRAPVIHLSLLLHRSFGAVFIMIMAVGMILFGVMYMIPQFLAVISGYNTEQAGYVLLLSGLPTVLLMPMMPKLLDVVDVRILVIAGLLCFAAACFVNLELTADTVGMHFVAGQLLQGCGLALAMMSLNQAAISSVPPELAGDASGLFNAGRNLGGSVGLALISTFQERRMTFHTETIGSSITANAPRAQEALAGLSAQMQGSAGGEAAIRSVAQFARVVQQQALVMTYSDLFWIFGMIVVCTIPLAFLLKPLPKGTHLAMH
ncbi:multidrug efflux MFS transporter [Xanthomonas melonis]|uniref:Multidrug efflux MFS transporter n=1 Tax=Xanthomonas melonis TaxID=56456 RepID=A0ABS8NXL8_9XANT|nr:MDR family MFS transporter [Xanthomonas melonis]MCD0247991.1 multidrug efflux MFS transporter [Xanthomonas melonis]MCD0259101.1 multidrug efflux MFS transporter [Xanthomonas melonis]MCD0267678.1 multidrug efflux MFS transporter [Xanthomonas melonis]